MNQYSKYVPVLGSGIFILTIVLLHFSQIRMSPLNNAMSYYVHGSYGWLLVVGLLGLGIGSLVLALKFRGKLISRKGKAGIILLIVWSIGCIIGAIFPADPPGQWDKPPSVSGAIHGLVAIVAILSFPLAAILISNAWNKQFKLKKNSLFPLAVVSVITLLLFCISFVPAIITTGPPILFGLTERVLFVAYIIWIVLANRSVSRLAPK